VEPGRSGERGLHIRDRHRARLAVGRRTFRPSVFGKIATATYIVTAVVAMGFNYLGYHSVLVDLFIWWSLAITLISSFHYIWHAARIIEAPHQSAA
jgi:hypothetical protein